MEWQVPAYFYDGKLEVYQCIIYILLDYLVSQNTILHQSAWLFWTFGWLCSWSLCEHFTVSRLAGDSWPYQNFEKQSLEGRNLCMTWYGILLDMPIIEIPTFPFHDGLSLRYVNNSRWSPSRCKLTPMLYH